MSPITDLTKEQHVEQLLTAPSDQLLGERPSAAEELASILCGAWFAAAPPEMLRMSDHPWGEWPNTPVLRDLEQCFDVAEAHADAALSLVRVVVSMYPGAGEPEQLGAELARRLTSAGATAPDWSLQLDGWRAVRGAQVLAPREGVDFDDDFLRVLEFEHPCGDRHGIALAIDPYNFSHIEAIDVFDDTDEFLRELRASISGPDAEGVHLESIDPNRLVYEYSRSIKKTYGHDFRPLRYDRASLDLFTLAARRGDCLDRPTSDGCAAAAGSGATC